MLLPERLTRGPARADRRSPRRRGAPAGLASGVDDQRRRAPHRGRRLRRSQTVAAAFTPPRPRLGPAGPSATSTPAPPGPSQGARNGHEQRQPHRPSHRRPDPPTLRYTAEGKAVANLRVAVNGRNDRVDFVDVTVWGKPAEAVAAHKGKGDQLGVTGRLTSSDWTDDSGQRHFRTGVTPTSDLPRYAQVPSESG